MDLIETDPALPAAPPFGVDPQPTWCYYFEKADLARQRGEWGQVADLAAQAEAAGFEPNAASEYIPFVEGLAHLGRWEQAVALSQDALVHDEDVAPMLCHAWLRIRQQTSASASRTNALLAVDELAGCANLGGP